ncbi:MAG: hypothetical protein VB050_00395 [Geobacteraceae bacterium]|nr:hypothetical protein [Geobacteraceae bacterium]
MIDGAGFVALANGGAFSGKIGAAVVAVRRGGATHEKSSLEKSGELKDFFQQLR